MKLSITYAELQDYVASHFHKTVNLGYVDGATVSVSIPIKVLGFTKSVSINITVKKIEGTDLFLSYGDIDKLQKVFEKLKLDNILFEQGNIGIEMSLVY